MKFMYMFWEDRELVFFETFEKLNNFVEELAADNVEVEEDIIYDLETGKQMEIRKIVSYEILTMEASND